MKAKEKTKTKKSVSFHKCTPPNSRNTVCFNKRLWQNNTNTDAHFPLNFMVSFLKYVTNNEKNNPFTRGFQRHCED